jgi:hypothetical protein
MATKSSLQARLKNVKEKAIESVATVTGAVESSGTAFALAYARARYSDPGDDVLEAFGLPLDLLAGLGLVGLSLWGKVGRYDSDLRNIGYGALCSYTTTKGAELGREAKTTAATSGALPPHHQNGAWGWQGHPAQQHWAPAGV